MAVSGQDAVAPFFLDLMPTILAQLNNGNKVIYGHVDDAMRQVRVSGWGVVRVGEWDRVSRYISSGVGYNAVYHPLGLCGDNGVPPGAPQLPHQESGADAGQGGQSL